MVSESRETGNMTTARSADHKRKCTYALFKNRFKVALGCTTVRTQSEPMIHRVQFIQQQKMLLLRQLTLDMPEGSI